MQQETVIVLDFGGQYNQLIARRVREHNVFCEVKPYKTSIEEIKAMTPEQFVLGIIRDCNDEVLAKNPNSTVLLPRFSCHTLRHTFTTRMCEAGVNIKVIQDALGHSDISTTLNIYADVTKELRKSEFENLDRQFAQWKDPEE